MSLLAQLPQIMEDSRKEYERLRSANYEKKMTSVPDGEDSQGLLFEGDNLALIADGLNKGWLAGKLDLIYCDPPFFTKMTQGTRREIKSEKVPEIKAINQGAYDDIWNRDMGTYLRMLTVRMMLMRDALSDTGSIFMHLDWHAVHVVKLIMDEIFGEKNFVNEIIWTYKSGGAAKRHFSKKHDTILFYSKTDRYKFYIQKEKSYNRGYKPYRFKGVEEFQDSIGWYTLVNQKDVWHIDMVGRSSGERVNYATQKPSALIANIIESVTDEGDICADFFCGSGTLAACAAAAGRRFICADAGDLACASTAKRLLKAGVKFEWYTCRQDEPAEEDGSGKCSDLIPAQSAEDQECKAAAPFDVDVVFEGSSTSLLGYSADVESMPVKTGQNDILGRLLQEDSLAFVDFWCSGSIDDEDAFVADKLFIRDKKGRLVTEDIRYDEQLDIESVDEPADRINAVLVSDIFGRTVIKYDKINI